MFSYMNSYSYDVNLYTFDIQIYFIEKDVDWSIAVESLEELENFRQDIGY